eukprot:TRINITY_DN111398_c0_g1_i1.p1 TRINITY_DN111398_c0_g1~~TRINITY_DN111398_c0_g1_i1.p1  ORF type:complete len:1384 (+),score=288.25 TRINITY_DN111398_c0_g1_i1:111-4262(+)
MVDSEDVPEEVRMLWQQVAAAKARVAQTEVAVATSKEELARLVGDQADAAAAPQNATLTPQKAAPQKTATTPVAATVAPPDPACEAKLGSLAEQQAILESKFARLGLLRTRLEDAGCAEKSSDTACSAGPPVEGDRASSETAGAESETDMNQRVEQRKKQLQELEELRARKTLLVGRKGQREPLQQRQQPEAVNPSMLVGCGQCGTSCSSSDRTSPTRSVASLSPSQMADRSWDSGTTSMQSVGLPTVASAAEVASSGTTSPTAAAAAVPAAASAAIAAVPAVPAKACPPVAGLNEPAALQGPPPRPSDGTAEPPSNPLPPPPKKARPSGKGKAPGAPPPAKAKAKASAASPSAGQPGIAKEDSGPRLVPLHWRASLEPREIDVSATDDPYFSGFVDFLNKWDGSNRAERVRERLSRYEASTTHQEDSAAAPAEEAAFVRSESGDSGSQQLQSGGSQPSRGPRRRRNTIFSGELDVRRLSQHTLQEFFQARPAKVEVAASTAPPAAQEDEGKLKTLIVGKWQQNLLDMMIGRGKIMKKRSVDETVADFVDAIWRCDYSRVAAEMLEEIRKVVVAHLEEASTTPNVLQYVGMHGEAALKSLENPHLHEFLYQLAQIPDISTRLKCMTVEGTFDDNFAHAMANLNTLASGITCLHQRLPALRRFFHTARNFGNVLNDGSHAPLSYHGFKLSSLPKFHDLRLPSRKAASLLHFVLLWLPEEEMDMLTSVSAITLLQHAQSARSAASFQACQELLEAYSSIETMLKSPAFSAPVLSEDSEEESKEHVYFSRMKAFVVRSADAACVLWQRAFDLMNAYRSLTSFFDDVKLMFPPPITEQDDRKDLFDVFADLFSLLAKVREEVAEQKLREDVKKTLAEIESGATTTWSLPVTADGRNVASPLRPAGRRSSDNSFPVALDVRLPDGRQISSDEMPDAAPAAVATTCVGDAEGPAPQAPTPTLPEAVQEADTAATTAMAALTPRRRIDFMSDVDDLSGTPWQNMMSQKPAFFDMEAPTTPCKTAAAAPVTASSSPGQPAADRSQLTIPVLTIREPLPLPASMSPAVSPIPERLPDFGCSTPKSSLPATPVVHALSPLPGQDRSPLVVEEVWKSQQATPALSPLPSAMLSQFITPLPSPTPSPMTQMVSLGPPKRPVQRNRSLTPPKIGFSPASGLRLDLEAAATTPTGVERHLIMTPGTTKSVADSLILTPSSPGTHSLAGTNSLRRSVQRHVNRITSETFHRLAGDEPLSARGSYADGAPKSPLGALNLDYADSDSGDEFEFRMEEDDDIEHLMGGEHPHSQDLRSLIQQEVLRRKTNRQPSTPGTPGDRRTPTTPHVRTPIPSQEYAWPIESPRPTWRPRYQLTPVQEQGETPYRNGGQGDVEALSFT